MEKRAAISLSINLLVVIIISLVILSSGIALLYKLVGGAKELKTELDARTQAELERLLIDEGKRVALAGHTAYLYPGESHIFGLGILNIDESEFGSQFKIDITPSKAYNEEGDIDLPDTSQWLLYHPGPHLIEENQHHSEPIMVNVPKDAPSGTYIFNVQVSAGVNPYDHIKKFSVVVK